MLRPWVLAAVAVMVGVPGVAIAERAVTHVVDDATGCPWSERSWPSEVARRRRRRRHVPDRHIAFGASTSS